MGISVDGMARFSAGYQKIYEFSLKIDRAVFSFYFSEKKINADEMGKYQIGYCSRLTSQVGWAMEAMRKGRSMAVFRADCSDQFFLRMSMS